MTQEINIPYFTYFLPALVFGVMADSLITLIIAWILFYIPPFFMDVQEQVRQMDEEDEFRI